MPSIGKLQVKPLRDLIVVAMIALFVGYVVWGSYPDPRMTMKELGGLTSEQVIARLGPPGWDSRVANAQDLHNPLRIPAGESKSHQFSFTYFDRPPRWRGYQYSIIFRNNRVAEIKKGAK